MSWLKPAAFVLTPYLGGVAGTFITSNAVKTWYKDLVKPSWTPPDRLFGPVWTILYASMGYASYLVYRDGGGFEGEAANALKLYAGSLALNWMWTPIFFGAKRFGLASVEILMLVGSVAACSYKFYPINSTAAYLMLPYLAWGCLASSLNIYIFGCIMKTKLARRINYMPYKPLYSTVCEFIHRQHRNQSFYNS